MPCDRGRARLSGDSDMEEVELWVERDEMRWGLSLKGVEETPIDLKIDWNLQLSLGSETEIAKLNWGIELKKEKVSWGWLENRSWSEILGVSCTPFKTFRWLEPLQFYLLLLSSEQSRRGDVLCFCVEMDPAVRGVIAWRGETEIEEEQRRANFKLT